VIILLGLVPVPRHGTGGYADGAFPTKPAGDTPGLVSLKPTPSFLTGIFILILTPIFRVGVSVVVFLKEKDYMYVGITAFVFLVLLVSLVLGKANKAGLRDAFAPMLRVLRAALLS
jgi:uncharacterized membrane protein